MAIDPLTAIGFGASALSSLFGGSDQRRAQEAQQQFINDLLTRSLGLAENVFAGQGPLREAGRLGALQFLQRGGRGIFNTPFDLGQPAGSTAGNPGGIAPTGVDIGSLANLPGGDAFTGRGPVGPVGPTPQQQIEICKGFMAGSREQRDCFARIGATG